MNRNMARPKKAGFSRDDERLAELAKALSAPAKVAILRTLARRNTCICGEIVDITPLSQSTVSQHLRELKELGLIQGRIEGVKSCYCINQEGFSEFAKMWSDFIQDLRGRNSGKVIQSIKRK